MERMAPHRSDGPLRALTVSAWLLWFVALFGAEARAQLFVESAWWPLVVLVGLSGAVALVARRGLINQLSSAHDAAPPEIVAAIAARAAELGLKQEMRVVRSRGGGVNAWVWETGSSATVAITTDAIALFESKDERSQEQFRALIDHELGHLWHGDTRDLITVRALFFSAPALALVKVVLVVSLMKLANYHPELDMYRGMPAFLDGPSLSAGFRPRALELAMPLYIGVTIVPIALLALIVAAFQRRREYLADAFALRAAPEKEARIAALAALLETPRAANAPAPSFRGALRSHPSSSERVLQMERGGPAQAQWHAAMAITFALVGVRLVVADTTTIVGVQVHLWTTSILSASYFALTLVLVASFVRDQKPAARVRELLVSATTCAVASALVDVAGRLSGGSSRSATAAAARRLEAVDALLVLASFPITVAVIALLFAIGHGRQRSLSKTWRLIARNGACAGASVFVLITLSVIGAPLLHRVREPHEAAVLAGIDEDRRRDLDCANDAARDAVSRAECEEHILTLNALEPDLLAHLEARPHFAPASWLLLFERPFRRPAFRA